MVWVYDENIEIINGSALPPPALYLNRRRKIKSAYSRGVLPAAAGACRGSRGPGGPPHPRARTPQPGANPLQPGSAAGESRARVRIGRGPPGSRGI